MPRVVMYKGLSKPSLKGEPQQWFRSPGGRTESTSSSCRKTIVVTWRRWGALHTPRWIKDLKPLVLILLVENFEPETIFIISTIIPTLLILLSPAHEKRMKEMKYAKYCKSGAFFFFLLWQQANHKSNHLSFTVMIIPGRLWWTEF